MFIEETFQTLREDLGYPECTLFEYWQSMKTRGDQEIDTQLKEKYVGGEKIKKHEIILYDYLFNDEVFKKGKKTISMKLPPHIEWDVEKIQFAMMKEVEKRGITIEANPSSNLKVGAFERYQDLPLFIFHSIGEEGQKMTVTINTDDKGIFDTSLENEYSLLALAILKIKDTDGNLLYNWKQTEEYLRRLAHYGNVTRFS